MKNNKNQPGTMKNQPGTMKKHEKPILNHEKSTFAYSMLYTFWKLHVGYIWDITKNF